LSHLLNAKEVAIEAVTTGTYGHLKIEEIVDLVWLLTTKIKINTGTAGKDAAQSSAVCLPCGNKSDPLKTLLSDAVSGK
jgi:hypothetical protein